MKENGLTKFLEFNKAVLYFIACLLLIPVGVVQTLWFISEKNKLRDKFESMLALFPYLTDFEAKMENYSVQFSRINGVDCEFSEMYFKADYKYVLPFSYTRSNEFKSFLVEASLTDKQAEELMRAFIEFAPQLPRKGDKWLAMYDKQAEESILFCPPYAYMVLFLPMHRLSRWVDS